VAAQVEAISLDVIGLVNRTVRRDQITDPPRDAGLEILLALLTLGVIGLPNLLRGVRQEDVREPFVVRELLLIRDAIE
jgi:hypothetical protein